jgi:hypothetical protein
MLALRGEGIADKRGIWNRYDDATGIITFRCPKHGAHTVEDASSTLRYRA